VARVSPSPTILILHRSLSAQQTSAFSLSEALAFGFVAQDSPSTMQCILWFHKKFAFHSFMLFMLYEVVFNVFIIGSPYICETKPKFYNQNGYWCLKRFHQSQLTTNIKAVL
jgi:hypothetical protein